MENLFLLNSVDILLATVFIAIGATLQASTGLGAGLIIIPLLALVNQSLIPGPMIFASLALSFLMSYSGRKHIKYNNLSWLMLALCGGVVLAALVVSQIPLDYMGIVFGLLILVAVLISIMGLSVQISPLTVGIAGSLAGFMGTSAGIGAPVLALLYQHEQGNVIRPTLGLIYFLSSIFVIIILWVINRFGMQEFVYGLILMPGFFIGYWLSPRLAQFLDAGYSRKAILWISTTSAILLISKSLFHCCV